jgi:hypothetical protein
MKRFLYLALAILCIAVNVWLQSCDSYVEKFDSREQDLRQQRIEKHITDTTDLEEHLYNVKFDGHLYVVYKEQNGYGFGAAMVHSPNCKCDNK